MIGFKLLMSFIKGWNIEFDSWVKTFLADWIYVFFPWKLEEWKPKKNLFYNNLLMFILVDKTRASHGSAV